MKISIEVEDSVFAAKAINNAACSYEYLLQQIKFGCYEGCRFQKLYDVSQEDLDKQMEVLKSILNQFDEASKEKTNDN